MSRFNLPRLIGITGKSGSGKDTLADYLVRQHGYVKYSLAGPIKKLLNERFGWTDEDWQNRVWKETTDGKSGWNEQTCVPFSPRSWAQWLGTEVGRAVGGQDVWLNPFQAEWFRREYRSMGRNRMVVPDIRFDNEAARIHYLGGVVLRIERPGLPEGSHVSDRGVRDELVNARVTNSADVMTFLRESVYALEACPRRL